MNPIYLPLKQEYYYPNLGFIVCIPCTDDYTSLVNPPKGCIDFIKRKLNITQNSYHFNFFKMTEHILLYIIQLRPELFRADVHEIMVHGHRTFHAGARVADYRRNIKRRMYLLS